MHTQAELARLAYMRAIIRQLGIHFPHTLGQFFTVGYVYTGYREPPRAHFTLPFQARAALAEEDRAAAFGTIIKVAGSLMRAGYEVQPTPGIKAMEGMKALDVTISGKRGDFNSEVCIEINFTRLPESDRCKLIEEQVLVPERYETKLRVECDGAPVQLAPAALGVDTTAPALVPEVL